MTQKLAIYTVSLFFEGQIAINTLVAGSEAEAVAQTTVAAARMIEAPLLGVGVAPIEESWLRGALRTIADGGAPKPTVVPLRSDNLLGAISAPPDAKLSEALAEYGRVANFAARETLGDALTRNGIQRCERHPTMLKLDGVCPACEEGRETPGPAA